MEERELKLMKGNEAIAEAAIRAGVDAFYGYPITPQTEVMEYLMETDATARTGMAVLQAESEISAINMVYGGAATGHRVMTSSSSPGISLMSEGFSYIAAAELPCLIINISRGGPGLGTIQPSQADYFQAVKGGGHGDYKLLTLAPSSVQELADFIALSFDLAFKYRNPCYDTGRWRSGPDDGEGISPRTASPHDRISGLGDKRHPKRQGASFHQLPEPAVAGS